MSGALQVTFMNQRSFFVSPYYLGILKPSSGQISIKRGQPIIANSDGMFSVCTRFDNTDEGGFQKLNYNGTIGFQKIYKPTNPQTFSCIFIDSANNIYLGGVSSVGASQGPSIYKVTSSNSIIWSMIWPNAGFFLIAIATDSLGDVYYVASKNSGDFESNNRLVVVGSDSLGVTKWAKEIGTGTSFPIQASGVSVNGTSVFAVGTGFTSSFTTRGVFCKLNTTNGNFQQSLLRFSEGSVFENLAQSTSGDCYIGAGLNSPNRHLILKLNASGVKQWGTTLSASEKCKVAIDSFENVYAAGSAFIPDIGSGKAISISKYNLSGVIQWQRRLVFPFDISANTINISVTSDGDVFVSARADLSSPLFPQIVALLNPDGSGTGTYSVDGLNYTYEISSYTVNTDSNSFTENPNEGIQSETRSSQVITPAISNDNLTWIETGI